MGEKKTMNDALVVALKSVRMQECGEYIFFWLCLRDLSEC